jgi:chromosomal replication initiation ATPase DnaA
MKEIFNTQDHAYLDKDVLWAFRHAMNLGRAQTEITPEKAFEEWMQEYKANTTKPLTLDAVTDMVCDTLNLHTTDVMVYTGRAKHRSKARSLICWFSYMYVDKTLHEIRDYIGFKDHSSVIHSHGVIESAIRFDKGDRVVVNSIKLRLMHEGYLLKYIPRNPIATCTVNIIE